MVFIAMFIDLLGFFDFFLSDAILSSHSLRRFCICRNAMNIEGPPRKKRTLHNSSHITTVLTINFQFLQMAIEFFKSTPVNGAHQNRRVWKVFKLDHLPQVKGWISYKVGPVTSYKWGYITPISGVIIFTPLSRGITRI